MEKLKIFYLKISAVIGPINSNDIFPALWLFLRENSV